MSGRTIFHLVVSLIITAVLLGVVFSEIGYLRFREIIGKIHPDYFLAYVACVLAGWVFRAYRTSVLVSGLSDEYASLKFSRVFLVVGIRNALVDFLPGRLGELSFVYFLSRIGVRAVSGLTSLGVGIVLDLVGLCVVCSVLFLLWKPQIMVILVMSSAALMLMLVLLKLPRLIELVDVFCRRLADNRIGLRTENVFRTASKWLGQVGDDLVHLKRKQLFLRLLLITVALRFAKYGGLILLLLAVLHQWGVSLENLDPLAVIGAFVGAEAAASVPASGIMGFGVYEGAWSAIFSLACSGAICGELPVISISFVVHLLSQVVGYSLGLISILSLCIILYLPYSPRRSVGASAKTRP